MWCLPWTGSIHHVRRILVPERLKVMQERPSSSYCAMGHISESCRQILKCSGGTQICQVTWKYVYNSRFQTVSTEVYAYPGTTVSETYRQGEWRENSPLRNGMSPRCKYHTHLNSTGKLTIFSPRTRANVCHDRANTWINQRKNVTLVYLWDH